MAYGDIDGDDPAGVAGGLLGFETTGDALRLVAEGERVMSENSVSFSQLLCDSVG